MTLQPFKLHRPLVAEVLQCLHEIFIDGRQADKVIERSFKANPRFGKRDRAFIAEQVYNITRNYILISSLVPNPGNLWNILGGWLTIREKELPDWPEFEQISINHIQKNLPVYLKNPVLKWSIPKELNDYGLKALPDRWYKEISAMHGAASLIIRVNTLKSNVAKVTEGLKALQVDFKMVPGEQSNAIVIEQRISLFSTLMFKQGWVEVQDHSSQEVGHFVDPKPGMRIIDACAGGGGKSLHLAALMENKGRIISMDVEAYKLDNLKVRAKRAGAGIIECRLIENRKVIKRLEGSADKVLLDVPCTGSGVLKRNPDAKFHITSEYITQLTEKQKHILDDYASMVKPSGELIYVTCSIFPDENENQINLFLTNHPEFELVKAQHLWPSEFGFDGFFMAKMRKVNSAG